MKQISLSRREVAGTALGLGLSAVTAPALAQVVQVPQFRKRGRDLGSMHNDSIDSVIAIIGRGNEVAALESLIKLVRWLVDQGLLDKPEAEVLIRMLTALFSNTGKTLDQLEKDLRAIAQEVYARGNELASAIASIASQSFTWASKNLSDPTVLIVVGLVATDVGGALTGAVGLAAGGVVVATLGALAGAVAASAIAGAKLLRK